MVKRLCSARGCGRYRETGSFCFEHARVDNERRARKWRDHRGNNAAWRRLRALVLQRDNYRCQRCGSGGEPGGREGEYLSVHIDPRLRGDHSRARLEDCQTLCLRCHGSVDAPRAHHG